MEKFPHVDLQSHRNLFQATDELRKLINNPSELTIGSITSSLGYLCGALTNSIDWGFEKIVRAAAAYMETPGYRAEAIAVLKEGGAFTRFIKFEKEALIRCGVSQQVAGYIADDVDKLQDRLMADQIDPEKTMAALLRCRDDVCIASTNAKEALANAERQHTIHKYATVASGVALGLANAAAITATGGAATPFVVLSTASGSAMIVGWSQFQKRPTDRKPQ